MLLSAPRTRPRAGLIMVAVLGLVTLLVLVSSPPARAATPGTFTKLASSPSNINAVATDPTTGLIYAQQDEHADDGDTTAGTAFYRFNPATNIWTTLAPAPLAMANNGGAAYLNGKIYVAYSDEGNPAASTEIGVYDIATNSWTTAPNPLGEATGDITAYRGLIYMVNGTKFVSYNPTTGTTTPLASAPDFTDSTGEYGTCTAGFQPWGSLAPYEGKIYGTEGNSCNAFAVYDIASNSWTELPFVPSGSVLGGAIDPVTGTFYTYGNYGGDTWDIYDIATGKWTTATYPYNNIDDGGLTYVSTPGLQGIYSTTGELDTTFGFYRYNTVAGAYVSVKKTASAKTVGVGGKFTYTLRVKNSGGSAASTVSVRDKLPGAVRFAKTSASAGKCKGKTTVTCSVSTLNAGKSVTFKIEVTAHKVGKPKNTATVSTSSFNANLKPSSSVTVKITAKKLKLSVTPHTAGAGTRTCYALTGTSGGKGVGKAKVSLAGHSATTSSAGHATLCLSLKKGTYHARISKIGYASATAAIRVTAAPSFTG